MDSMGRRGGPPPKPGTASAIRHASGSPAEPRPERPTKRHYTAEYKQRIIEELKVLATSPERGAAGAFLRREGLHWSTVHQWQQAARRNELEALVPKKRGRKPTRDAAADELERLRRKTAQLEEKLRKAEIIIDVQKKLAALLGVEVPVPPDEEEP
jgi:transposase